jgi:hypothetical protein
MTEPLGETPELHNALFTKDIVEKYKDDKSSFEKNKLRHYDQLVTKFDQTAIRNALLKFKIPTNIRVTVYGGYTGQFALALREMGMKVIFTDPMIEWVNEAEKNGFESLKLSIQEFPRELIEATDLFASFECYPDLIGENESYYSMMRLLTAKFGVLFVESRDTVGNIREIEPEKSQSLGSFRKWFRPLYRVYGIKRLATRTENLNFYNLFAPPKAKTLFTQDCRVMKAIYDGFEQDYRITKTDALTIANKTHIDEHSVKLSIKRLQKLSHLICAPIIRKSPILKPTVKGSLQIGSKHFFLSSE